MEYKEGDKLYIKSLDKVGTSLYNVTIELDGDKTPFILVDSYLKYVDMVVEIDSVLKIIKLNDIIPYNQHHRDELINQILDNE